MRSNFGEASHVIFFQKIGTLTKIYASETLYFISVKTEKWRLKFCTIISYNFLILSNLFFLLFCSPCIREKTNQNNKNRFKWTFYLNWKNTGLWTFGSSSMSFGRLGEGNWPSPNNGVEVRKKSREHRGLLSLIIWQKKYKHTINNDRNSWPNQRYFSYE